jgi:hypothetical protein
VPSMVIVKFGPSAQGALADESGGTIGERSGGSAWGRGSFGFEFALLRRHLSDAAMRTSASSTSAGAVHRQAPARPAPRRRRRGEGAKRERPDEQTWRVPGRLPRPAPARHGPRDEATGGWRGVQVSSQPTQPKPPSEPKQRDRAFRALATEAPEIIPRLLTALGITPAGGGPSVAVVEVLATGLDPPAARIEADLVVRLADNSVRHVEWQGWRDTGFRDRCFRYHLLLAARLPLSPVRTVVIWSRVPSADELAPYAVGQMTLCFDHIILAHEDPEALLADPATACFAMACRTDDPAALAVRVIDALQGAPPRAAVVAALAAAAVSPYIYDVFAREWKARGMEPIIIEELARMLEDRAEAEVTPPLPPKRLTPRRPIPIERAPQPIAPIVPPVPLQLPKQQKHRRHRPSLRGFHPHLLELLARLPLGEPTRHVRGDETRRARVHPKLRVLAGDEEGVRVGDCFGEAVGGSAVGDLGGV